MSPTARPALPRGLVVFWAVILAGAAGGIGYLQYLGPLPPATPMVAHASQPAAVRLALPVPVVAPAPLPPPVAAIQHLTALPPAVVPMAVPPTAAPTAMAMIGTGSELANGAAIPAPDAALMVPAASNPAWLVPQIGADGTVPMRIYAASTAPATNDPVLTSNAPRVAVMVTGLGDDISQSLTATSLLPPQISLALTPYGAQLPATEAAARATGHEMLLVLPMPALQVKAPLPQNQATLDWSMSRLQGYAGVTDAFNPAIDGGFLSDPFSKSWLMTNLATRGLFYIESNANEPVANTVWGRNADVVIDPVNDPEGVAPGLTLLTADAQSQQSALGIMLSPTPDAIRALAAWTTTLANQDILLVPISALAAAPAMPMLSKSGAMP